MTQEVDVSQIIETTAQRIYDLIQKNGTEIKEKANEVIDKAKDLATASKDFVGLQNTYLDLKKLINKLTQEINELNKNTKNPNIDKEAINKNIAEKEKAQGLYLEKQKEIKEIKDRVNRLYSEKAGNAYKQALLKLQLASYDLQKKFAELQNKDFVIDYVVYNRGRPIIYRFPYEQFEKMISFDSKSISKGLLSKIQFSKKQLEKMIDENSAIQKIGDSEENLLTISEHARQIQRIYSIAYKRYDKNPKGAIDIKLAQKFEKTHKILRFLINNKGDLAEGYVRFLYILKEFNNINLNIQGKIYEGAEIFWINEEENDDVKKQEEMYLFDFLTRGVIPVTNQSGFFIEDVTSLTKQGKILESAVKFGGANPLQLTQVIQLSNQILSLLDKKINKQEFIRYLNNDTRFFKGARRNGLQNEIKEGAKLMAEKDIYEYLTTIVKSI